MSRFFISTPLDFEKVTLQEMQEVWPYLLGKDAQVHSLPFPEVQIHSGGLEFEADLITGIQLNFFLKTANRVLLRLASFKARDLPKFYQKFRSLPWLEYLAHANVEWEVAAQKSRLNNEKRLQESAETALGEVFKGQKGVEGCGRIFIRMDEDLCTISLDTTGEHLHKRGWSVLKGEAPVRETIAAFILRSLLGEASGKELSETTLLDPMMGSGTFLAEARALYDGNFSRSYAFQQWKKVPKLFLSPSFAFNYTAPTTPLFKKYVGFDLNPEMPVIAEKNFKALEQKLEKVQRSKFQSAALELATQDGLAAEVAGAENLWLVVNPPYGERLSEGVSGGLKGLVQGLLNNYKPQKLGVIYPDKERLQKAPDGYKIAKELKINNGGIRCLFTLLTRV